MIFAVDHIIAITCVFEPAALEISQEKSHQCFMVEQSEIQSNVFFWIISEQYVGYHFILSHQK